MRDDMRDKVVRQALNQAIRGTPLSLFANVTPYGDTASEQVNALLDDGRQVTFQRRTTAVQRTDAFIADEGKHAPLTDGEYRLKDGTTFAVVNGAIDFDAVLADPDGVEPFRQYGAWREVVAIDNPLLTLENPAEITDTVRFLADDGNSYYAIQAGVDAPYQAYVVKDRRLTPLSDGTYPLPAGGEFEVSDGFVRAESLSMLKVQAYKSTRLPL